MPIAKCALSRLEKLFSALKRFYQTADRNGTLCLVQSGEMNRKSHEMNIGKGRS